MRVPYSKLGTGGVVKDLSSYTLPPHVWSDAYNIRFEDGKCKFFGGWQVSFAPPPVQPWYGVGILNRDQIFWIYLSGAKAYVWDGTTFYDITRAVGGNYTAGQPRFWNSTFIGGIPIFNNGFDVPQYWTGFAVGSKLANLTNWTAGLKAKVVRSFGKYLVAMDLVDGANNYPHAVQWSHPADPGALPASWDITDATKEAGRRELTDDFGGGIQDGLPLGNLFVIYKNKSTHLMRYIGGTEIMGFDLLLLGSGLLAPRCVCAFKKGTSHFVVTDNDIIVHSGTKEVRSVVDKKVRKSFFLDMDPVAFATSFVFEYEAKGEVWLVYPQVGQSYPNKVLVWNYNDDTITFRDWIGHWAFFGYVLETDESWDASSGSWDSDSSAWSTAPSSILVSFYGDASKSERFWTGAGNAQISTVTNKFGGGSLALDGAGDWVSFIDNADFTLGSSDFTIDCWFNCTAVGGIVQRLASQCDAAATVTLTSFRLGRTAANVITASACVGGVNFQTSGTTQFTDVINPGWHHLAWVRTGGTLKLFIDGVQEGSDVAITGSVNDAVDIFAIGARGADPATPWTGFIDEFRLSVGVARWTANFTPPTAPYSADSFTKILMHFDGAAAATSFPDSAPLGNIYKMDFGATASGVSREAYVERTNASFIVEKGEVNSNFTKTKFFSSIIFRGKVELPSKIYIDVDEQVSTADSITLSPANEYVTDGVSRSDILKPGTVMGYRFVFTDTITLEFEQMHVELEIVGDNIL